MISAKFLLFFFVAVQATSGPHSASACFNRFKYRGCFAGYFDKCIKYCDGSNKNAPELAEIMFQCAAERSEATFGVNSDVLTFISRGYCGDNNTEDMRQSLITSTIDDMTADIAKLEKYVGADHVSKLKSDVDFLVRQEPDAYTARSADWYKDIATADVTARGLACLDPSGSASVWTSRLSDDAWFAALKDGLRSFIKYSYSGEAAQKDVLIGFREEKLSNDSFEDIYSLIEDDRLADLSKFALPASCNMFSSFTTENVALASSLTTLVTSVGSLGYSGILKMPELRKVEKLQSLPESIVIKTIKSQLGKYLEAEKEVQKLSKEQNDHSGQDETKQNEQPSGEDETEQKEPSGQDETQKEKLAAYLKLLIVKNAIAENAKKALDNFSMKYSRILEAVVTGLFLFSSIFVVVALPANGVIDFLLSAIPAFGAFVMASYLEHSTNAVKAVYNPSEAQSGTNTDSVTLSFALWSAKPNISADEGEAQDKKIVTVYSSIGEWDTMKIVFRAVLPAVQAVAVGLTSWLFFSRNAQLQTATDQYLANPSQPVDSLSDKMAQHARTNAFKHHVETRGLDDVRADLESKHGYVLTENHMDVDVLAAWFAKEDEPKQLEILAEYAVKP